MERPTPTLLQDKIHGVMVSLGIKKAHFVGRMSADWRGIAEDHDECIASLTLLEPTASPIHLLSCLGPRATVLSRTDLFCGGKLSELLAAGVTHEKLPGDEMTRLWSDVATDNRKSVLDRLVGLKDKSQADICHCVDSEKQTKNGITFQTIGSGPGLLLFPLGLAPSGWTSVVAALSRDFCVVLLTGPLLGMIPILEDRGLAPAFSSLVRGLTNRLCIPEDKPSSLLEVGSGTGVLLREIWNRNAFVSLTGVDFSPYLVDEAKSLAAAAGMSERIEFEVGNGEKLSQFGDCSFDAVMSVTVAEELDADRLIAEMVRIVKPGGLVGIIIRAEDIPFRLNVSVPKHELEEFQNKRLVDQDRGASCSTSSLYGRLRRLDLVDMIYGPQFSISTDPNGLVEQYNIGGHISTLAPHRAKAWAEALDDANTSGTFYFAWPHHVASARRQS